MIHKVKLTIKLLSLIQITSFARIVDASTLSLKDSIKYAAEHAPTIKNSRTTLEISGIEKSNAFSAFLPSIDLSTSHGAGKMLLSEGKSYDKYENPWISRLSLSLTENLYDNHQSMITYKASKLNLDYSKKAFRNESEQITRRVAKLFYDYSLSRQLLKIEEEQFELTKQQFLLVEAAYRQGMKTREDFLRFKTSMQRLIINLSSKRAKISSKEGEIKSLIGVPISEQNNTSFVTADPWVKVPPEVLRTNLNVEGHREKQLLDLELAKDKLNIDLAKNKYGPEVTLKASMNYINSDYLGYGDRYQDTNQINSEILLGVNYNLWDWGVRRRNVLAATKSFKIKENMALISTLQLKQQISKLGVDLKQLIESSKLSQELLELEKKSYNILKENYRNGKASYLDLQRSLENLAEAKTNQTVLSFTLSKALVDYFYHKGKLHETLLKN